MRNSEYWKRRFILLEQSLSDLGLDYWRDLEKEYRRAIAGVESDIAYWYQKFAVNNEISFADAKKLLNNKELEEFKWTVDDYIKYGETNLDGQWTKQLVNASSRVHISRLTALETTLRQRAEVLAASLEAGLTALGSTIYTEAYYHAAYEIQKGLNIGWQVAVDENRIKKVLSKPWTTDAKTFSDRIWTHKQELLGTIQRKLTQTIICGDSPDEAIQVITDRFTANKNQAARLVMTESSFFAAASMEECYDALEVEKYRIVATLDLKTSKICREMDGKVFDRKDYKPGVTANPFHPWCRTTTCPHTDGPASLRMARNPKTGKSEYVPGDITYKGWYQKFVVDKHGEDEAAKMQKMAANETQDRDQYQDYKAVLDKAAPKTFKDFQDLKYNDSEGYKKLRDMYNSKKPS